MYIYKYIQIFMALYLRDRKTIIIIRQHTLLNPFAWSPYKAICPAIIG